MSYSMGSIDCLAVVIDASYKKALIEDIKNGVGDFYPTALEGINTEDLENVGDITCELIDDVHYYDSGKYSENYAYAYKLNVETGKFEDHGNFEGFVYEFSWGAKSIYEPEFKNKEDLIEAIKLNLYIPTNFDLESHIIFLTGVWGG